MGLSLAGNSRTASKVMTDLRALAARADAAERLAKAAEVLDRTRAEDGRDAWMAAYNEHVEALAAWRAITKSEVPS